MIFTDFTRRAQLHAIGLGNNPFLAWDNLVPTSSIFAGTTAPDGDALNVTTGTTYDRWRPAVEGSPGSKIITFTLPDQRDVTMLGLSAMNLAQWPNITVRWEYSLTDVSAWVQAAADAQPSRLTDVWRVPMIRARRWRLTILGIPANMSPAIGVIFIGREIIMPQRFFQGYAPIIVSTDVELQSNVSEGGNLLGSAVARKASDASYSFDHIKPDFIRSAEFKGMMQHFNYGKGIFAAWRPERFPEDVSYGWRMGSVIRPSNTGPKDYMGFSMAMRAFDG